MRSIKRLGAGLLVIAVMSSTAIAHAETKFYLNGYTLSRVPPYDTGLVNQSGSNYVPARMLLQASGYKVTYDSSTQRITGLSRQHTIVVFPNSNKINVDGVQHTIATPDGAALRTYIDPTTDRLMVPVRMLQPIGAVFAWETTGSGGWVSVTLPQGKPEMFRPVYLTPQESEAAGYSVRRIDSGWSSYKTPTGMVYTHFDSKDYFVNGIVHMVNFHPTKKLTWIQKRLFLLMDPLMGVVISTLYDRNKNADGSIDLAFVPDSNMMYVHYRELKEEFNTIMYSTVMKPFTLDALREIVKDLTKGLLSSFLGIK